MALFTWPGVRLQQMYYPLSNGYSLNNKLSPYWVFSLLISQQPRFFPAFANKNCHQPKLLGIKYKRCHLCFLLLKCSLWADFITTLMFCPVSHCFHNTGILRLWVKSLQSAPPIRSINMRVSSSSAASAQMVMQQLIMGYCLILNCWIFNWLNVTLHSKWAHIMSL